MLDFPYIDHIKIVFYIQLSDRPTTPLPYQKMSQHIDHGLKDKIAIKWIFDYGILSNFFLPVLNTERRTTKSPYIIEEFKILK